MEIWNGFTHHEKRINEKAKFRWYPFKNDGGRIYEKVFSLVLISRFAILNAVKQFKTPSGIVVSSPEQVRETKQFWTDISKTILYWIKDHIVSSSMVNAKTN